MKLVKIEDVRVGQIYLDNNYGFIRVIIPFDDEPNTICGNSLFYTCNNEIVLRDDFEDIDIKDIQLSHTLIGFIGITHEIKDNKLVEIPRDEFEIDDVVVDLEEDDETSFIITAFNSSKKYSSGIGESTFYFPLTRNLKKMGIYGVTHEFVNERLVK